jgi:hypothetical protein
MHPTPPSHRPAGLGRALLACLLCSLLAAAAAAAQDHYRVQTPREPVRAVVGKPVAVSVAVTPRPSGGASVSVLAESVQAPDGPPPLVEPGPGGLRVTCRAPGRHVLRVRVSLVSKSSCGGVEATPLAERDIVVDAHP